MKKWLAALLTLCLMLSMIPTALAEDVSAAVDAPVAETELALDGLETGDAEAEADAPAYAKNGWQQIGGSWYYYAGGRAVTGWRKIGAAWYLFNASGVMQNGWRKSSSAWYYLASSGAMATSWQKIGGIWYYFNSSGAMATGWQKVSNAWYYFNSSGAMVSGWQKIGGAWYYFKSSGAMATGWQKIGGKWYYFKSSGAMHTGWLQLSGKWYYFESSGAMVTGKRTIDGKQYTFDANGVMQTGGGGISESELRALYQRRANQIDGMDGLDAIKYYDVTGDGIIDAVVLGHSDDDEFILQVLTYRNNAVVCILDACDYGIVEYIDFCVPTKSLFYEIAWKRGTIRRYLWHLSGDKFRYMGGEQFSDDYPDGYWWDGNDNSIAPDQYYRIQDSLYYNMNSGDCIRLYR